MSHIDRTGSADIVGDPIHIRAMVAGRALVADFADLDTDADLAALHAGLVTPVAPRQDDDRRRWFAAAAAAVLVVAGTVALVVVDGRRDDRPTEGSSPTTLPTTYTTLPNPLVPSSTLPPTTTTSTTTPPTASVATVSYLDSPPVVALTPLATLDVPDPQSGAFAVGIGDGGVVVSIWDGPLKRHHLVSFDGQVRTFEVADSDGVDGTVIAVGPAEVAYLTQGQFPDFWIVAVSLAPDRLGEVIGRWDADVNRFLEYPPMTFGHSDTGLFDRRFDDRPPIVPHIDSLGVPITSFDAPPVFSVEHDNGLGGLVTSSDGGRWMLAVDAAPDRADRFVGASPPAPGADGRGVYVTYLGNADPSVDFGVPAMWVVAELAPGGTATWWSLPEGWEIVASDVWATVAARRDGNQLQLASVDFGA